jgi:hypothetical protein
MRSGAGSPGCALADKVAMGPQIVKPGTPAEGPEVRTVVSRENVGSRPSPNGVHAVAPSNNGRARTTIVDCTCRAATLLETARPSIARGPLDGGELLPHTVMPTLPFGIGIGIGSGSGSGIGWEEDAVTQSLSHLVTGWVGG